MADIDHRRTLENWYSRVLTDNTQKIAAVKSIFEAVGVRKACEEKVNDYTEKAMAILANLPQNAATEELRKLAQQLHTRTV
jgi:geranylgeranyl diphosphate synthase type II